jgi:hypothetical protein
MNMDSTCAEPPAMEEVLRPQLSAKRNAGIVTMKIRRAEIPDARKAAVLDLSPAEAKSSGAYYCTFINSN